MKYLVEYGTAITEGMREVESRTSGEVLTHVRELRSLMTPTARDRAVGMLKTGLKMDELDRGIADICLDQWVDWHWSPQNTEIHPKLGMLLYSLALWDIH